MKTITGIENTWTIISLTAKNVFFLQILLTIINYSSLSYYWPKCKYPADLGYKTQNAYS